MECLEDRTVPTATVTAAAISDSYEGGSTGVIRLTRTETSGPLSVNITMTGTATESSDYLGSTLATFSDGNATVDVLITAENDSTSELTETVIVTVTSGTGYNVGSPASATCLIWDNDAQYVSVSKIDNATEGATGKLRFTRSGDLSSSLTANYSVGGTATSSTDYTALGGSVTFAVNSATVDVNVVTLQDNVVESGGETVSVTVTTGTGYSVGSPSMATVTIADDPPVISVTATDTAEASATGGFTFTRSGGKLSASLNATYTVSGTSTSGTDYTALGGTVAFAANEDRVEVRVEAFGDNTVDDAETVIATISSGGTNYTIDSAAGAATVTIADQPLTISVEQLSDGEEGVSNGTFRFTRAGDISAALTVTYTVSGTATSGTDFTALSGSVTFAAKSDHTDVTVTLSGDSSAEDTETVTVTIDEDEDYQLGSDSDSLFLRDDDTRRIVWAGRVDGNWRNPLNWETFVIPTSSDEVYFNGSVSNVSCTNFGEGWWVNGVPVVNPLTSVSGLHIVNAYSGVVTLGVALTANTYEQLSGTLNQPSGDHLTITKAMIWTGGTLNGITDSVCNVNIDGAAGRIDPPDVGHMDIASTLRVINNAAVNILPGNLDFIGGQGVYINAQVNVLVKGLGTSDSSNVGTNKAGTQWEVDTGGMLQFKKLPGAAVDKVAEGTTAMPLRNNGIVSIPVGIKWTVNGHLGGGNGPSIKQEAGTFNLYGSSEVVAEFGMTVTGGDLRIAIFDSKASAVITGDLTFSGANVKFFNFQGSTSGVLEVRGDVTWTAGTYQPIVDGTDGTNTKRSLWTATGTFKIDTGVGITPQFVTGTAGNAGEKNWTILAGKKGVKNLAGNANATPPTPALPAGQANNYDMEIHNTGDDRWWDLHRKPG